MGRPRLDPFTLRWLADEMAAEAEDSEWRARRMQDTPGLADVVTWHRHHAKRLRNEAKRLRNLATRDEARRG